MPPQEDRMTDKNPILKKKLKYFLDLADFVLIFFSFLFLMSLKRLFEL